MNQQNQVLYGQYDSVVLRDWVRRMHKFRFCHAFGGHANDPDTLQVRYRYDDEADLQAFCASLGISLTRYDVQPPQPEIGTAYSADEMAHFPSLVRGTHWIAQPGQCQVAGEKVFAWCDEYALTFSLGEDYVITERDVRSAEAIESVLAHCEARRIDPPVDNWHCLCPKYHPDYFANLSPFSQ